MTRTLHALALALLLLPLAACQDDPQVDASPNSKTPIGPGDSYVALGDSYTAGPLLGKTTGAPGCGQSARNYPHLVAKRLDLELTDVSCGGARTEHLERRQRPAREAVPPQLDAVSEGTDLVTLSIGANNQGLFGTLVLTCVELATEDPDGSPCADRAERNDARVGRLIDGIGEAIEEAVDEILDRAPDARVVVISYPQVFPPSGTCEELPLATGDYPYAYELMRRIVQAQEAGAEASGAEFIDVWSASEGHDICADDPWIAGAEPTKPAVQYHPYVEEQRLVADLLVDQVTKP